MKALAPLFLSFALFASGCIEGSSSTTINFGGTYLIITDPVNLRCQEKTTGLAMSMTPLPSQEFRVEVTQDGENILLHSIDFNWNLINMRQAAQAGAQGDSTNMNGTVAEDGTFFAESYDHWPNAGDAGPVDIHQRFEGKFTDKGVAGAYIVEITLLNYNTECSGTSGFTGEKLN
ncbi:MAG: hypothetical protein OEY50_01185 [Nitrospinota bacterium]|nr:hypothetical protein [Nitrospinota bacterium]